MPNTKRYLDGVHRVDLQTGASLVNNFISRFTTLIRDKQRADVPRTGEYDPTKYVWVALEDLRSYIDTIDEVQRLNGKEVSGIAFNIGAYDLDKDVNGDEASQREIERTGDYRGRITMLMAPTFVENGEEPALIENHKQFYIQPTDPANPLIGSFNPLNFSSLPTSGTTMLMNELNSVPPYRN